MEEEIKTIHKKIVRILEILEKQKDIDFQLKEQTTYNLVEHIYGKVSKIVENANLPSILTTEKQKEE